MQSKLAPPGVVQLGGGLHPMVCRCSSTRAVSAPTSSPLRTAWDGGGGGGGGGRHGRAKLWTDLWAKGRGGGVAELASLGVSQLKMPNRLHLLAFLAGHWKKWINSTPPPPGGGSGGPPDWQKIFFRRCVPRRK